MLRTATSSITTITSDEAYIAVAAAIVASILLVATPSSLAEIAIVAATELSLPHMMLPPLHD